MSLLKIATESIGEDQPALGVAEPGPCWVRRFSQLAIDAKSNVQCGYAYLGQQVSAKRSRRTHVKLAALVVGRDQNLGELPTTMI